MSFHTDTGTSAYGYLYMHVHACVKTGRENKMRGRGVRKEEKRRTASQSLQHLLAGTGTVPGFDQNLQLQQKKQMRHISQH